jgi:23S rRNA (guanine2445-N2)-methyltransferase / 23S rRNA (guanine2069-N7)-methyltransferase
MTPSHRYAATCPRGVEALLADELRALGAGDVRETRAAVTFSGPLIVGYRACLWSRLASRVLLTLGEFPAASAEELYAGVAAVAWEEHIAAVGTLAVDVAGTTSGLAHTRFTAQKTKDAIVDRLRERHGARPSVDFERPDVRVNVRLHREQATLSLDLSGEPLHMRGYRTPGEQAEAPLKENLAAAVLVRAGWPEAAAAGGALVDPMCGSGTLLVEGALIAAGQAPGLLRGYWGFAGWLGHDEAAWHALLDEADERAEAGRAALPVIAGYDADGRAVALAHACAKRAGFGDAIAVAERGLEALVPPPGATAGLVVTNPPYGVRLGDTAGLEALYALLGERLLAAFDGWNAAVLTSEESLARSTGLRSHASHTLYNGAIETRLYRFVVTAQAARAEVKRAPEPRSAGAVQFANRLRKNARHLGKWARREGVTCYRVYDADLPDYAVAVDLYQGTGPDEGLRLAHVAEYAPPASIDPAVAEARLAEAVEVVAEVLEVAPSDVAVKVRRRQRGTSQYERQAERGEFIQVAEGGLRFLVNLHDYLDTGIFLDHRPVRAMVRELATGRRVLNLFAYTGTASVYAAAGDASAVNTVDLSGTYIDWARQNMALNGFADRPGVRFMRSNALTWLAEERRRVEAGVADPYGLVFCDPPTFSASKKMGAQTFDVQRDHVALITDAAAVLADDGVLLFSTNLRSFALDREALGTLEVEDITAETIPPDFARNPKIHRCFRVRRG